MTARHILDTLPTGEPQLIAAYLAGAEAVLQHIPNPSGSDPMCIDTADTPEGTVISLLVGRWIGPYEADFS